MHSSTFEYLMPAAEQRERMQRVRDAAKAFADTLEKELPDGPDKTYVLRKHRTVLMWANVAITRQGAPW